MRDIEFRAIVNEKGISKCWIEGSLLHITRTYKGEEDEQNCDIYQIVNADGAGFFIDKDTIGQYTGLKDKNGTKIFEGDILPFTMIDGRQENYYIVFRDGEFDAINKQGTNFIWRNAWKETAVIGNIYDNPELLEKE